jgi:plasmid stability protein
LCQRRFKIVASYIGPFHEKWLQNHENIFTFVEKGFHMAILQVRDIDDNLYQALKKRAKDERRSVSQEIIKIVEDYLESKELSDQNSTTEFLNLTWQSDETAEELIGNIRSNREENSRLSGSEDVFD